MNVFVSSANALVVKPVTRTLRRRRAQAGGFALVVTLLIVSLLAVVAVSYLTSMLNERVTADAYTSQTRAEQAAQAGVEAAQAILAQSFRDFPDSATVWDPSQSPNGGAPVGQESKTTVTGSYNEGTTLYLRAVPKMVGIAPSDQTNATSPQPVQATVADPHFTGATVANDPNGNNPSNLNCKTFVLPLISGIPGGYAQVLSEARPGGTSSLLRAFDLTEMDPSKQTVATKTYCADLNVRRSQGDLQGAIGSPPNWISNGTTPVGPKPARALWVNLKSSTGLVTGRYAFWMEDESFRANSSYLGNVNQPSQPPIPPDNTARPKDSSGNYRSLLPSDLTLVGPTSKGGRF